MPRIIPNGGIFTLASHTARCNTTLMSSNASHGSTSDASGLPEVAVIDDSRALLLMWRRQLRGEACVHLFERPEAFRAMVEQEPALLDRLSAVVLDYRFPGSLEDGLELAACLRARAPRLRLILSSSGVFACQELVQFDVIIDKSPISLAQLIGAHSVRRTA